MMHVTYDVTHIMIGADGEHYFIRDLNDYAYTIFDSHFYDGDAFLYVRLRR